MDNTRDWDKILGKTVSTNRPGPPPLPSADPLVNAVLTLPVQIVEVAGREIMRVVNRLFLYGVIIWTLFKLEAIFSL